MTGQPGLAATLLLAGLVAAAAGCEAQPGADEDTGGGSGIHYVALGDSFTSGPGIDLIRTDPGGCGRSFQNYPAFLADWLDVDSYTDVSCAGATTRALSEPQTLMDGSTVPPQLGALSEETTLVTMGFGANDTLTYAGIVGCREAGAPCFPDDLMARTAEIEPLVAAAVEQVREKAPEADILVVGYPQVLPAETGCATVTAPPDLLARLSDANRALNEAVEAGATQSGATYVDLWTFSLGHHACAGEGAWIVGNTAPVGAEGAPFHPNLAGMRAAAGVVYTAVTGAEPPSSERAEPAEDAVVTNPAG